MERLSGSEGESTTPVESQEGFEEISQRMGSLLLLSKAWSDLNHPSADLANGWNSEFYAKLYPDLAVHDTKGLLALAKIDGDVFLKAKELGHWIPHQRKGAGNSTLFDNLALSLAESTKGKSLKDAPKKVQKDAKDSPVVLNRWEGGMPATAKVLGAMVAIDSIKVTGQLDDLEEDANVENIYEIMEFLPREQEITKAFYNAANN